MTKDSFDYWQDWLSSLQNAQLAMLDNQRIFPLLREMVEKAVEDGKRCSGWRS
jgi:hypothetical protein